MKVLDLYAGLLGWSRPFAEAGHETFTIEWNRNFPDIDWYVDMFEVQAEDIVPRFGVPDLILASPPCEAFSVARIGKNWIANAQGVATTPKTQKARDMMRLVEHTLVVIRDLQRMGTPYWVMENPRAALRVLPVVENLERRTVTYCTLGESYMKPTDLWGGFPPSLHLPDPCQTDRNHKVVLDDGREFRINKLTGEPCHEVARRGAKTGLQGIKTPAGRGVVPPGLARLVMEAAERDLAEKRPARESPRVTTSQLTLNLG